MLSGLILPSGAHFSSSWLLLPDASPARAAKVMLGQSQIHSTLSPMPGCNQGQLMELPGSDLHEQGLHQGMLQCPTLGQPLRLSPISRVLWCARAWASVPSDWSGLPGVGREVPGIDAQLLYISPSTDSAVVLTQGRGQGVPSATCGREASASLLSPSSSHRASSVASSATSPAGRAVGRTQGE